MQTLKIQSFPECKILKCKKKEENVISFQVKEIRQQRNVLFEGWLACQLCLGAICRKTTFEINVRTKGENTRPT